MRELYIVRPTFDDPSGALTRIDSRLTSVDGRDLENTETPVAENEIRAGVKVSDVGEARLRVPRRVRTGHVLNYHLAVSLILSEELYNALREQGISVDTSVYPWALELAGGRPDCPKRYRILWPQQRWDILDHGRSSVRCFPGTTVIAEVKSWSIDWEKVPLFDLFATDYWVWLVSKRAVEVMQVFRPLGARFTAVT